MSEIQEQYYWVADWHEGPELISASNKVEAIKKARNLSKITPDPGEGLKAIFVIEATLKLNSEIDRITDQQEKLLFFQNLKQVKAYSPVE